MTWETIADIATAIGTFVALAGVITTVIINVRAERAAAARSKAATRLDDANTRRAINALERIANRLPGTAGVQSASRPRVAWEMRHIEGDRYVLENAGDAAAHQVTITTAPHANLALDAPPAAGLGPGEVTAFRASTRLTTTDNTLT